MDRRRWLVLLAVLAAVVVIGALRQGATGRAVGSEDGGGCGGLEAPDEAPQDVFVAPTSILRSEPRPGPDDVSEWYVQDRFIVKLRSGVLRGVDVDRAALAVDRPSLGGLFDRFDAKGEQRVHPVDPTRSPRTHARGLDDTLRFSASGDPKEVLDAFGADPDVEWIEQDSRRVAYAVPNDPFFVFQWHMQTLSPEQVWAIADGTGTVVAVVDTGVTELDDGFGSLAQGFDFVQDDTDASDENGHGTHVAGTIAQSTNNGVGVVGLAKGATILPVRVLDANGSGLTSDVAAGVRFAVDHGADVINLSLGGPTPSPTLEQAVLYAEDNGVIVVAATGNDGFTDSIGFPAAYDSVIAVGATDLEGEVTFYSNQGPGIDIAAPGGDTTADLDDDGFPDGVLQETFGSSGPGFFFYQGTSMATPHVAAAAAILISAGVEDVRKALLDHADDRGAPGPDNTYGHGIVNPLAALQAALPSPPTPAPENTPPSPAPSPDPAPPSPAPEPSPNAPPTPAPPSPDPAPPSPAPAPAPGPGGPAPAPSPGPGGPVPAPSPAPGSGGPAPVPAPVSQPDQPSPDPEPAPGPGPAPAPAPAPVPAPVPAPAPAPAPEPAPSSTEGEPADEDAPTSPSGGCLGLF